MNYKNYDNYGRKHSNYYKGPGYYYKKTYIPVDKAKRSNCITIYSSLISLIVSMTIILNSIINSSNIFIKTKLKFYNDYEIKYDEYLDDEFMYVTKYKKDYQTYYYVISTGTKDNHQNIIYKGNEEKVFVEILSIYFPDKNDELTNCINKIYEYGIEKDEYYRFSINNKSTKGNTTYYTELLSELKEFQTLTGYYLNVNNISFNDIIYDLEYTLLYNISYIIFILLLIYILIHLCIKAHRLNVIKNAEKAGDASKYYEGEIPYEEFIEKVKLEEEKREKIKQEKKK